MDASTVLNDASALRRGHDASGVAYFARHDSLSDMIATLKTMLPAIAGWPAEDQQELAEAARDIEARRMGVYSATPAELDRLDEGLDDIRHGRIASPEAVAAVRARIRTA